MQVLVWSGLFFLLSVSGSAVGLAGMIGMPIAPDIHTGVLALAVLVVISGIALAVGATGGARAHQAKPVAEAQ